MIPFPDNKYDIVYTDPPWPQTKGNKRKVRKNQGKELDYQVLSLADILEIHADFLTKHTEDTNTVFIWAIDKYLFDAEQMMENFGYKLHARIIWNKLNGVAPAFTIRYAHEYLLWWYRPKMLPINKEMRGKYTTVITEKATKHSKKPIAAYEMIKNLYPIESKIELFARNIYDGFDSWGDQV